MSEGEGIYHVQIRPDLLLRQARLNDALLLFAWRNDHDTIRNSVSPLPVAFSEHEEWLLRSIASPDRVIYMAEDDGIPVGTGRLDLRGRTVELSLTVAPEFRGQSYGRRIIAALILEAERLGGQPQTARVRLNNVASMIAFLKAGFVPTTDQVIEMERKR